MLAEIVNLSKIGIVQLLFVGQRFFKRSFELLFADLLNRPEIKRTYNPNKGCKDLTQRREGVEKARKENHFKKRE